jgi:hypothetical protein
VDRGPFEDATRASSITGNAVKQLRSRHPRSGDAGFWKIFVRRISSMLSTIPACMKMWAGRGRGHGEFYRPHIEMTELEWSTANFLNRVERDLAGR